MRHTFHCKKCKLNAFLLVLGVLEDQISQSDTPSLASTAFRAEALTTTVRTVLPRVEVEAQCLFVYRHSNINMGTRYSMFIV